MWGLILLEVYLHSHCLSALENLALGRPVWEDQPWRGKKKLRGDKAVDGLYTKRTAAGGQCVKTYKYARTATWRVDLGGVVSISHIDIYYRTDNLQGRGDSTSRMAGFFLYVSNTTAKEDGHLCFHEIQKVNGTPSEDQRINCSVHGRYVFYYNERLPNVTYPSYYSTYAFYDLCELEVYEETQTPLSCDNNNFCVISIIVSVVILSTGSVLNYIYWKKNNAAQTSQKRQAEESELLRA